MNNNPLVSVIVPCFNQGKYVKEALLSVKNQTFANIECVIVNDGSTDNSLEEIRDFCKEDNRFFFYDKENEGVAIARNYAIAHSHGEFILPLDADDKIAPEYIQAAVDVFNSRPDVKLVYSKVLLFGYVNREFKLPEYDYSRLLCSNHIVCTAMYRRIDYNQTDGYNPNLKGWEDWDFWLCLLKPDDVVYRIDDFLFYYRIKKSSRNVIADKSISQIRRQIWENHKHLYSETYMDPTMCEEYRKVVDSYEYRVGVLLLKPIRFVLSIFRQVCRG